MLQLDERPAPYGGRLGACASPAIFYSSFRMIRHFR
jgi:hypothetical protein